ncbi:TPA: hypothetical protein ACG4O9_002540, partial [Stenotrophomonas maltophilia]
GRGIHAADTPQTHSPLPSTVSRRRRDALRSVEPALLAAQKRWKEREKKMDYCERAQRATRF